MDFVTIYGIVFRKLTSADLPCGNSNIVNILLDGESCVLTKQTIRMIICRHDIKCFKVQCDLAKKGEMSPADVWICEFCDDLLKNV